VNIQDLDLSSQIVPSSLQGKLPFYFLDWNADFPGTDNFVSCYLGPAGAYSATLGYKNQSVFNLYNQTLTEHDSAKLEQLYKQIQAGAFNDHPSSTRTSPANSWYTTRA
jgi:ABC-type transport system substrate-binding protein